MRTLDEETATFINGLTQPRNLWSAGFNSRDSLIYAIARNSNILYSIDANGVSTQTILSQSLFSFNADVDTSNALYTIPFTGDNLISIDLGTLNITTTALSQNVGILDDIS